MSFDAQTAIVGVGERIYSVVSSRPSEEVLCDTGIALKTLLRLKGREASNRHLISLDNAIALASGLDISLDWLLTGHGPERPFEGASTRKTIPVSPTRPPGAIEVVHSLPSQVRWLPVLGRIEAGFSALAIHEAELRDFSIWQCPRGEAFALKVHGDSMVDVGIHSGDIVILRAAISAEDGEVVAATIGEESMLKLLRHDADGWWLVAANRAMTDRRPLAGATIHGVVHTVIRQIGSTPFRVPESGDDVQ